jgi:hypothetical protein
MAKTDLVPANLGLYGSFVTSVQVYWEKNSQFILDFGGEIQKV